MLRRKPNAVATLIRRAAQHKRRVGLRGPREDYTSAINYLKKYRDHMDFAERASRGEPIGSGIAEAGCKVIFNQRLKQSGMRWLRDTGQYIVDLRTAKRGGLWSDIWRRVMHRIDVAPPITRPKLGFTRAKPE